MDVGSKIAAHMALQEVDQLEEELRARLQKARLVTDAIVSGTKDEDLTPEQANAMDEYEFVNDALREIRGRIS